MERKTRPIHSIFFESPFVLLCLKGKTPPSKHELNYCYHSPACCSNTWRIPGLLSLFTDAKLQLGRCHFGGRIKPMQEKPEITNDTVKTCWIKLTPVTAMKMCSFSSPLLISWELSAKRLKCLFCYPSAPSVSIFPLDLKIFLPLLGVNS